MTTPVAHRSPPPAWAQMLRQLTDYLAYDCGGGPRPWKFSWVVNFQKFGSFVFFGLLLWYYQNTSIAAWIYVALHGTYGLLWFLKDMAFPDANWQRRITLLGGINAFVFVLGPYWIFGWILISGFSQPAYPLPDYAWYGLCITLSMFGSALMIAADAQKYFTLRLRSGLITDGVHAYIRHPNYLGEMMVYAGFALLVWHWFAFAVLAWVWLGLFVPNMLFKEASMSRHPEWAAYQKRSWCLLPFIV